MCDRKSGAKTVPCLICTKAILSSSRRFGVQCCGACASFFSRSILNQDSFDCEEGTNECLKEPCVIGKSCRRCRFDKCLEVGMSNHELNPNALPPPPPPPPPPPAPAPAPVATAPESDKSNNENVLELKVCSKFAKIVDQVFLSSMDFPNLLESYLLQSSGEIFNIPFEILTFPMEKIEERLYFLTFLLQKSPITETEFPVFLYFCLCKLEFPNLSISEQIRIKNIQFLCEQKFQPQIVSGIRLTELSLIAQNFFNVFKAFL